ncbi:MAG TPA: alkaline phosphatase family protein [Acidimicrobiales bacterium]|nr:alkaline phosphatase family protein [Acidimicrobiales bacterium]
MGGGSGNVGGGPRWSRRQVLAAGVAGGLGAALGACGRSTVHQAASVATAGSDLGAVEHVVFLMMENRSFDHYFGTYPGVRGFGDHPAGSPGVFAQAWPGGAAPTLLPFHLDTAAADAECTHDLSHDWDAQHFCWHGGAMDRFVATHTEPAFEGPGQGELTMGYYTRADLDFWYALADAFTICDGYHCSVFGPTHPNRLHALSGTLDPAGTAGGPVLVTGSSASLIGSARWEAMPERLQAHGVSWKVYNPPGDVYRPDSPLSIAVSDNILLYFDQHVRTPSSALYRNAFDFTYPDDFTHDVAAGTLPAVSWICPGIGQDEHPPAPPAVGMHYAAGVLQTLVSNSKVWAKTVLFVMYDENDGFFDHVSPPVPAVGTAGEYLTVHPLPADAKGIAGPIGLGFRVPMLVVSPFSRGGYVCPDVFDHTSQLRFLETRFGVPAPNISAWRRKTTGDLTATLHVATPDASVPMLPATSGAQDPRVVRECQPSQLVTLDVKNPAPYPVPSVQTMPTQEPGAPRPVPT